MGLPPQPVIDQIEDIQRIRGWIISSYSQIEHFLGDIIFRSMEMPEYNGIDGRLPHGAPDRIRRVRRILQHEGFFKQYSERIAAIVDQFQSYHDTRVLLAHGFSHVEFNAQNQILCTFRKWHRSDEGEDVELRQSFFPVHLAYQSEQLKDLSQNCLTLFREIHVALGLADE